MIFFDEAPQPYMKKGTKGALRPKVGQAASYVLGASYVAYYVNNPVISETYLKRKRVRR